MRITAISLLSIVLFFGSCSKMAQEPKGNIPDLSNNLEQMPVVPNGMPFKRSCASVDVLKEQLKENPGLAKKMEEIEMFTKKVMQSPETYRLVGDVLELPVHVNLLYRTTAENISQAQIQSQIDILNKDFQGTNADIVKTPLEFQDELPGDLQIRFVWKPINTTRKKTTKTSWGTRDAMKSTKTGGLNPVNPLTTLNIWVCTIGGDILGYAQFPGGKSSTDGVVIDSRYFGNTGTASYPFNLGRTATHEVGHWFSLRHIWGDALCGDDFIGDTPTHDRENYGDPDDNHRSLCPGNPVEMTVNYMDYTDDRGMFMFTRGQSTRMKATYVVGGPRASLR